MSETLTPASSNAPASRPMTTQTGGRRSRGAPDSATKRRPGTTSQTSRRGRKKSGMKYQTSASIMGRRAPHGHGKARSDEPPGGGEGAVWVPPSRFGPGHWVRKNKVRPLPADVLERLTKPPKRKVRPRLPATGKYLRPGGGRFSNAKPKSEIDWVILRAKDSPGPSAYRPIVKAKGGSGTTKISDANPKSDVDWVIYRSKQTPGPSEYKVKGMSESRQGGGRFSTAFPMSDLEWTIYRSKQTPAPDEYLVDRCPTYPKSSRRWVKQLLKQSPIKARNPRVKRFGKTFKV